MKPTRAAFHAGGEACYDEATWAEEEAAVRARYAAALQAARGWQWVKLHLELLRELRRERVARSRNLHLGA